MRQRITLASVARLQPGQQLWDEDLKGFGVRRQKDVPSYFVKTRIGGRQRWVNIGKHGSPWTPETARREAKRILGEASTGNDVAAARIAHRRSATVADVAQHFIKQHLPKLKPRTRVDYVALIGSDILPKLGTKKMVDLSKADVSRLHSALSYTPRKANLTIAVLSKLISWAIDQGYRPEAKPNPCKGVERFRENARERYLTPTEVDRLLAVLAGLDINNQESPFVTAAVRLLLLTGARLSEITTLKWAHVDLETSSLWLPDSKTGKKLIRLNAQAVDILHNLPRVAGNAYVIVGEREGQHLINLQKPWRRIRALAALNDVRIHDLRHSFASIAINAGASLAMVGKLLGHSQPQTTARYAHLADDPLRELNDKIGNTIAATVTSKTGQTPSNS